MPGCQLFSKVPSLASLGLGRHKAETLRQFLEDVCEGLPERVLSSVEKRDKALQQLQDALGVSAMG